MSRKVVVKEFAFTEGEHGEADARVLPDGYLTRAKNVRLRKDGRFGVRADYDAIGNDTANAAHWLPYDVIGFADGLLSVGDGKGLTGDTAPWDIAAYTGTAPIDWRTSVQAGGTGRIGLVTNLRSIEGPSVEAFPAGIDSKFADCAAANGIVAHVFQTVSPGSNGSAVLFLRASSGEALLTAAITGELPHVVSVGTKFFVSTWDSSGSANVVRLWKFDPASDTALVALTSYTHAAGAIVAYDAVTSFAGTGFWLAVNGNVVTKFMLFNSSGVAGTPLTGPATIVSAIAIRETSSRVHIGIVDSGSSVCELRSYTTAGSLSTGPTTIAASASPLLGMTDATFNGTQAVSVYVNLASGDFFWAQKNATTHATVQSFTWKNSFLVTKPLSAGAPNYHHVVGIAQLEGDPNDLVLSNALVTGDPDSLYPVHIYTDKFAASTTNEPPQLARDATTGKYYWARFALDPNGGSRPSLSEFDYLSSARRQTAQIGGKLYLASGLIETYDGRSVFESGFFEKPSIIGATPSSGAGALPSSTTLLVALTWEFIDAQGDFHTSDVSNVVTVPMGASDNTITLTVNGPHGIKGGLQSPVTAVAWRSIAGINQLRRAETLSAVGPGAHTITLLLPDTVVRANGVIYTQAGAGELSGTLPHEAPPPADYLWKFGSRLLAANADQAFVSKALFPGQPVNWSGAIGFLIPRISERIVGVAALDARGLLFTSERLYQFSGDGPDDNGAGSYGEPALVPGSTGLRDWRSLVETPIGLFFQGSNGQLWVLPRDGSPPSWIGQPVRDTLVAYPVVTSATLVTQEQLVSFTCNNAGLTDSRVVHYDLRVKTWIVDEFASATPIASATSYQGRLAMLSSGVVYTERTTLTPSAFIEHGLTTGPISLGGAGWRKFATVGLVGEYRGDCNVRCRVAYDQSQSFTTLHSFPLLASGGLSVGDTVHREWSPLRRKAEYLELVFEAITAGTASEGFVFNKYWIAAVPERGTSRSPAAQRG